MVFGTDIFFTKDFCTTALQFSVSREDTNGQGVQERNKYSAKPREAIFSERKGASIGTHEEYAQKRKEIDLHLVS